MPDMPRCHFDLCTETLLPGLANAAREACNGTPFKLFYYFSESDHHPKPAQRYLRLGTHDHNID